MFFTISNLVNLCLNITLINNYFFIPSIGWGIQATFGNKFILDGTVGMFWSSNGSPAANDHAQAMNISYDGSQIKVVVSNSYDRILNIFNPLKFE